MGLPGLESNGRPQDTETLYREHGAAVARLCGSLLRDRTEAEDATQQVFLAAHRALLNGTAPREPLAWLLAVARHECYARFRQRTVSPVPTGDLPDTGTPDVSAHVLRAGELAAVWDEVERMPPAQREAFLLREIRGLSYGQLAAELSLSPPSVRSLLLRARTRLRNRLRGVAAGFGGAPWIQLLVRLVSGGEGASPLPAATKAAAVGVGALALVGGGNPTQSPHHALETPRHAATPQQARGHEHHAAAPTRTAITSTTSEHRGGHVVRRSEPEHSRSGGSSSSESGFSSSGSDEGGVDLGTSSGDGSSGSGGDGSDATTTVARRTSDGSDGSGSTSSGPGPAGSTDKSSDGGSSGSSSGPGDGSTTTTTTTTTTTSSGSDGSGSGHDGGGSGGSGHG